MWDHFCGEATTPYSTVQLLSAANPTRYRRSIGQVLRGGKNRLHAKGAQSIACVPSGTGRSRSNVCSTYMHFSTNNGHCVCPCASLARFSLAPSNQPICFASSCGKRVDDRLGYSEWAIPQTQDKKGDRHGVRINGLYGASWSNYLAKHIFVKMWKIYNTICKGPMKSNDYT